MTIQKSVLSPLKWVSFQRKLHCCHGRRHEVTCARRKSYVTCAHNIIFTWRYSLCNSNVIWWKGDSICTDNTPPTNSLELYVIYATKDQGFVFRMVHKTLFYCSYLFRYRLLTKVLIYTVCIFRCIEKKHFK